MKEGRISPALSGVELKRCPSFETLSRFLDGVLGDSPSRDTADHLASCAVCAQRISEVASLDILIPLSLPQTPASPCPHRIAATEEHLGHLSQCPACRARLGKAPRLWLARVLVGAAAALLAVGVGYGLLRPMESPLTPVEIDAQLSRRPDLAPTRVAVAVGDVGLDSNESPQLRRAVANSSLRSGDRVTTQQGQRVKLSLEGGGDLLINENTRLSLARSGVKLEEGELVALTSRILEIETPSGTAMLSSGELHVESRADQTSVSLLSGGGDFRGSDPVIALVPDQELRLKGKAALKMRRNEKRSEWAEPIRNVYYVDQFESAEISPFWRIGDSASRVEVDGRPALSLSATPRSHKRGSFVGTSGDFPVGGGISFEIDVRVPLPTGAGRVVALLQSKEGGLSWSISSGEESLDIHPDLRSRHSRLWSAKKGDSDGRWQRMKIVVTPHDVALYRDGTPVARKPHGLVGLDRVSLVLGTQTSGRLKDAFECQVGRVAVQREPLQ